MILRWERKSVQVFVKFFTKKKVIFFALRVKVKKFKKMKKMPLFAFPHKAWGGGVTMRHRHSLCELNKKKSRNSGNVFFFASVHSTFTPNKRYIIFEITTSAFPALLFPSPQKSKFDDFVFLWALGILFCCEFHLCLKWVNCCW